MKSTFYILTVSVCWLMPALSTAQTVNDPLYNQQTYLQTINISGAWGIETGLLSTRIGILAPGGVYAPHEDLSSRVTLKHQSAVQGLLSHGTIVAGIAGAATNNSKGISGINWSSPIYSYDAGKVETYDYELNGVQYSEDYFVLDISGLPNRISSARSDNIDILVTPFHLVPSQHSPNISAPQFQVYPDLAPPQTTHFLQTSLNNVTSLFRADQHLTDYTNVMLALREAYKDDMTIITPMPEYDGVLSGLPANLNADRISIAVGSTTLDGSTPFEFSASGSNGSTIDNPDVDIVAPGVDILTTSNSGTSQYSEVTTTTASSGIVSGVASLLKSNNPNLKPDDIREILRRTADAMGPNNYDPKTGFGRVNAQAALQYLQDNTITHGELTDVTITKVESDQQRTLIKGAWGRIASGAYRVDIYEVKGTIDLPSGREDVWYRANGTTGWSFSNPNLQRRFALVDIDEVNKKATLTTYVYHVKYNSIGHFINQWHPIHKDNAKIAYTLAGDPVPPPPPTPPSTPTGVTASACSYCTPYVNWPDNPETDISHYEVWRQKDYSYNPYSMIGTTTNSYYYDNSLVGSSTWYGGGDNYRYAVIAVNTTNLKSYRSSPSGWINALERNKVHPGRVSEEALPESFALRDNYPNPFNPSTVISFDLPEASVVTLKVFNIMGQEVATLVNQNMEAGRFTRNFDAANLSSGFYIARFEALGNSGNAYTKTIKMQLIK